MMPPQIQAVQAVVVIIESAGAVPIQAALAESARSASISRGGSRIAKRRDVLRVIGSANHKRSRRAARTSVAVAVATGGLEARCRDAAGQGVAPGSGAARAGVAVVVATGALEASARTRPQQGVATAAPEPPRSRQHRGRGRDRGSRSKGSRPRWMVRQREPMCS